jgi:two-component system NtrC family sensor kinase
VIYVSTRHDPARRAVFVEVSDNGSGIAPKDIETIFTPFFSQKGHSGTGLGLAVAEKIIDEHDGKIKISSTVGVGTTFRIKLPAAPEDPGKTIAGDLDWR